METDSICALVREKENNYTAGTTHRSKYVDFSMYDIVERIIAYLNSVHISGSQDSLGRDKPFFNIVTAAVNVWYRATDLDRKDIRIKASKIRDQVKAFIATIHLKQWMKKAKFGVFLNQWGRTLAQYGSAVVKFVEVDGILKAQVIPWNRIIVDAIDFENNVKIEKLFYTPSQLRNNKLYDQDQVENLIVGALQTRTNLDGQEVDTIAGYIPLYEVHGELPLSYLTGKDKDKDIYRQQMRVVSFIESKPGKYQDYTLYKGKESKDPYMLTHLIEEEGRTLSIGAVESLFDAQWMINHSMKQMKDTLDIASKLVFQTSDSYYVGRNMINQIETGDILLHKENMPLTQVNNTKADITAVQNFASQWRLLSQELTSTPDAMRGNTLPSGTPYSLGAYLGGQANNLFEQMTENKGLAVEEMLRKHILPNLKKGLNNADEIAATLEDNDLAEIDSKYVPFEAVRRFNQRTLDKVLNEPDLIANPPDQFNAPLEQQAVQEEMKQLGNKRFFVPDDMKKLTWAEYFKDFEWDVDVEVTNESMDKASTLQSLASMLQTATQNPELYKLIVSKIADVTGVISPMEIKNVPTAPQMTPTATG